MKNLNVINNVTIFKKILYESHVVEENARGYTIG